MKRIIAIPILLGAAAWGYFGYRAWQLKNENDALQARLDAVVSSDPRNNGIKARAYVRSLETTDTLIYDVESISGSNSRGDLFRVFAQLAEKMDDQKLKEVHLACQGKEKFALSGDDFQELGKTFATENPVYIIRTFPEKLKTPEGAAAFEHWEGGLIGVTTKQMQDFNDFADQWCFEASSIAP